MLNEMVKPVSHKDYDNFIGIEYPNEWLFKLRSTGYTVAGCIKGGRFFVLKDFSSRLNDAELIEIMQIASEFENVHS